jgi:hypothetical protein
MKNHDLEIRVATYTKKTAGNAIAILLQSKTQKYQPPNYKYIKIYLIYL